MPTLFSVLVPVYNVEKYLSECIESVLGQTNPNFELILIDDGSTDTSGKICDDYAVKDARIKVFHQANQGHTLARRKGIAEASSDYLLFLDSDDYWDTNLLETILHTIEEFNCDMVIFRFRCFNEANSSLLESKTVFKNKTVFGTENRSPLYHALIMEEFNSLCIKAIKRNIFDKNDYTSFKSIKNGEDLLQTLPLITNAHSIVYIDRVLYNYRINPLGIAHNYSLQKLDDILCVRSIMLEYLKQWGANTEENLKSYHSMTFRYLLDYGFMLVNDLPFTEKKMALDTLYALPAYALAQPYYKASMYLRRERILFSLFRHKHYRLLIFFHKLVYWWACLKIRLGK